MAALCGKLVRSSLHRNVNILTACRGYAKVRGFHDPLEHATGLEKRELLAYRSGNTDPYNVKARQRKQPSTRDDPNLVPSVSDERMIGCVCEQDATSINFMWVYKDEPTRCECGHWFKLSYTPPI